MSVFTRVELAAFGACKPLFDGFAGDVPQDLKTWVVHDIAPVADIFDGDYIQIQVCPE